MRAAECCHVEMARLLLEHRADPNYRSTWGRTATEVAGKTCREDVLALFQRISNAIAQSSTWTGSSTCSVAARVFFIGIGLVLVAVAMLAWLRSGWLRILATLLAVLAEGGATLDSVHLSRQGHEKMAHSVWSIIAPAYGE